MATPNLAVRIVRGLRTAGLNLAILITLLAGIELLAFTYYTVRRVTGTTHTGMRAGTATLTTDAGDLDRSWLDAYFAEFDDPRLLARWTPYVYWRRSPFKGRFITVDEHGLRATWNPPASGSERADVVEVAVFGGSATWGTGARDEFTIPSYVSKIAAREFPDRVHVTNYGQTGYVTTQSAIALLREIHAGQIPDIVIFYEGLNDVFSAYQNGVAGLPQNEANRIREFNLLNPARSSDLYWEVLSRTNTYALAKGIRQHLRGPGRAPAERPEPREGDEKLTQDLMAIYAKNVALIEGMAKTWGFTCRFYWQPTVFTKRTKTRAEQEIASVTGEYQQFYGLAMNALKQSTLVTTDPDFRDLSGIFDSYGMTTFIDEAHTTEQANEVVANQMFVDLADLPTKKIHPIVPRP